VAALPVAAHHEVEEPVAIPVGDLGAGPGIHVAVVDEHAAHGQRRLGSAAHVLEEVDAALVGSRDQLEVAVAVEIGHIRAWVLELDGHAVGPEIDAVGQSHGRNAAIGSHVAMEGDQAVGFRQHVDVAVAVPSTKVTVLIALRKPSAAAAFGEGQQPLARSVLVAEHLVPVGPSQKGDEEVQVPSPSQSVQAGDSQPVSFVVRKTIALHRAGLAAVLEAVAAQVQEDAKKGGAALDEVEVAIAIEVGEGVVAAGRDLPAAVALAEQVAVPHQSRIAERPPALRLHGVEGHGSVSILVGQDEAQHALVQGIELLQPPGQEERSVPLRLGPSQVVRGVERYHLQRALEAAGGTRGPEPVPKSTSTEAGMSQAPPRVDLSRIR
jgi:hypothetical protein